MQNFSKPHLGGVINVKHKALLKSIGQRIKTLRDNADLSQEKLANEAGIITSQIGRIERGEINPTISTLFVIAKALKTTLRDIVDVELKKGS